ncbi:hypothetical protein SB2_24700 [Methylobacterium radiotolerans]|nr:hypothetical protein SB3_09735 [Methylobacterium radiotolerans]KTS44336.1 hypothetical protein SB2_24700 [Methylobacterium radiotolerans]ONF46495.1 hypothetical protein RSM1_24410 [Methylobacterium radiotolerans]OXE40776.1 hypothetical protein CCS92_17060 [Methylobacterium radiotolerans]
MPRWRRCSATSCALSSVLAFRARISSLVYRRAMPLSSVTCGRSLVARSMTSPTRSEEILASSCR